MLFFVGYLTCCVLFGFFGVFGFIDCVCLYFWVVCFKVGLFCFEVFVLRLVWFVSWCVLDCYFGFASAGV